MKRIFFALLLLLIYVSPYAQMRYDAYTKKTFFQDDFDNNIHHWDTGSSQQLDANIKGGNYYLFAKKNAFGASQTIDIDTARDFEIEASIRFIKGGSSHKHFSSMLFWGRDSLNAFYFFFAPDNYCGISNCTDLNKCKRYANSLVNMHLSKTGFNKYTIRKIGGSYYFFVNEQYFYSMPFAPFYGNHIGIGAAAASAITIDYLSVSYL